MNKLQALEAFHRLPKGFEEEYRSFEIDPHIADLGRVINAIDGMKSSESCQGHLSSINFHLNWDGWTNDLCLNVFGYGYPNVNPEKEVTRRITERINEYYEKVQKPFAHYAKGFFYFSAVPTELSERIVRRIEDYCRTSNSLEFRPSLMGLGAQLINFKNYPIGEWFNDLGKKERIELSEHIKDYAIFVRDFKEARELELDEIAQKQFFLNEDKAIELQKNVLNSWSGLAKEIKNLIPDLELTPEIDDYESYYWKHQFNNSRGTRGKTNEINVGLLIECV